jgi:hypothetical protein
MTGAHVRLILHEVRDGNGKREQAVWELPEDNRAFRDSLEQHHGASYVRALQ